jgi:hypothetical protein
MPIETFNFIDSLNSSNPGSSDDVLQGDDHIRGIKSVLKNTFPNLAAAANFTAAQVNQLVSGIITFAAGSSGSPSIIIGDAASAFYRVSSGVIGFVGRLSGNGAVDVGSMHFYPFRLRVAWRAVVRRQAPSATSSQTAVVYNIAPSLSLVRCG